MIDPRSQKYQQRLNPWVITRRLPGSLHSTVIARFRRRVEAEGHLKVLQSTLPGTEFEVMWDASEDPHQA